ncbi:MAG: hypothetical protein ACI9FN_000480 [Saprospiraceae bacterium]|jgi:hypothetical protein
MKSVVRIYIFLFLLIPFCGFGQDEEINVLFVGNSFTYFWNVPQLVQSMAQSQDVAIVTRQSTAGGATWEEHWTGKKNLNTKSKIAEGDWDYVVLQNHSTSSIDNLERFQKYGKEFNQLIRANGAEPMLYMTWAYKSNPLMQPAITKAYTDLGEEIMAEIVPVGPVFEKLRQLRPDIDLFFDDKHQTEYGSYVIALCFYKKLSGKSVLSIPSRLSSFDKTGELTHLIFIPEAEAKFLRQLVEEFEF